MSPGICLAIGFAFGVAVCLIALLSVRSSAAGTALLANQKVSK